MDDQETKVNTWDNWKLPKVKLKKITELSGISAPSTGYYNEHQDLGNDKIGPAVSSVLIEEGVDINLDIEMCHKYKIFEDPEKLINLFVRRSALQRKELRRLLSPELINIKFKNTTALFFYLAFYSLFYAGSDLDAFHLNNTINFFSKKDEILREILCTRSFKQIQQIKNSFQIRYNLSDKISKFTHGWKMKFFHSLLNEERSSSVEFDQNDPLLSDFRLFLDEPYYKKNKEKFINLFTKKSYYEIRKMCVEFERVNLKTLIDTLKGYTKSRLKKYAKTICLFSINSHEFFSKLLRKYINKANTNGIIRIITSRAEIDLMTILRIYKNKNPYNYFNSLNRVFLLNRSVFYGILLPLMGLNKDSKI